MRGSSVPLWLLLAAAAVGCLGAAVAENSTQWVGLATAAGLLAVLVALQLLSRRLWRISGELKDAQSYAVRSAVSELHSMHVVLSRFPECSLPTTGYSMTFGNLHALLELLDELQPNTVVEFGSGMSTIMVAAWMKRRGMGRLHSFDHDPAWAAKTLRHLSRQGLDADTTVACVPLVPTTVPGHTVNWYDLEKHASALSNIEMVIVDGPPSHEQPMARLPALFALEDRLSSRCCILLDDALRLEERAVAEIWRQHVPSLQVDTISSPTGMAVFRRVV